MSSSTDNSAAARPKRVRISTIQESKAAHTPLTMLTAYDALIAPILDRAGVDMLLIGDSLGNVVMGYSSTVPVTLADMVHHTAAVARAVTRPLIVADLPFGTYETDATTAFNNAAQLMRAGANAVKLEGGQPRTAVVRALVDGGIPVMGHLGYTPQSDNALSGPHLQGRGAARDRMLADAQALETAGAFAVVLEMVPDDVATEVTQALSIPTIGIGAGPHTDGQVLVWADMAGMTSWTPSFVHRFGEVGQALEEAAASYIQAVHSGQYPAEENYHAH